MGIKPNEKGKKSEGLAALLRREEPNERTAPRSSKPEELNNVLRYVLGLEQSPMHLTEGGAILYEAVDAVLEKTVSDFMEDDLEEGVVMEGRLGPDRMEMDSASAFGHIAFSDDNPLAVESKRDFSSCRATHCFFAGRWMYEAILGTSGIQQIGWATLKCPFNPQEGVGDGEDSYAFDGKRVKKWSMDPTNYGQSWTTGDVIGCCADFDQGELVFYRNGRCMGTAYREIRTLKEDLGYFPAISLSDGERCTMNFGAKPFYFPIDGYAPCDAQPSKTEIRLVQYLMTCLERLTEITTARGALTQPPAAFPRSKLSVDEGVLIGALIVRYLCPLLRNEFHVLNSVLPSFRRILGKADSVRTAALLSLIDTFSNSLSQVECASMLLSVLQHLANSCCVSPFKAAELPYTASYPHLSVMTAMLKSPVVKRVFFKSPKMHQFLERCLARKQPTAEDLKDLLPNIWWKGCKDETMSEEIMNPLVSTLSAAYLKVEQMQFELLMVLVAEDVAENDRIIPRRTNLLLHFFSYLLEKNAGAERNIPPSGLSNPTVLVSVFNFLMVLLRPYFVTQESDGAAVLEEFPIRDLFIQGVVGGGANSHDELPRLGGLLSYLMKDAPIPEQQIVSVMIDANSFSTEAPRCPILKDMVPKLLHVLLLIFRLGIDTSVRLSMHQLQTEAGHRNLLLKMETKLVDPETPEREKKQLSAEIQKQKEEVIRATRESVWCRIVWFTQPKQKSLFLLTVYLSKLIVATSSTDSDLLKFVPEIYVEAIVEIFQALAKMETRFGTLAQLEMLGLQSILSFFVGHFSHPKIVNPQVCDSMLQALSTVFADKEFLKACQRNPDAQQRLIFDLLKAFDARHWLSISNIFLSIAKGTGFGHASSSSGSPVFRESFARTCSADLSLLDGFLNRLFNTLNWTLTELVITLSELAESLERGSNTNNSLLHRLPRKASVLFNLSVNLLKLLELVAGQIPAVFLTGSKLNITRAVEVVVYVLSHMTIGPDSSAFIAVINAPQTGADWKTKMSRQSILAPIAGLLIYLHRNGTHINLRSDTLATDGGLHSVVKILLHELMCPADRLRYLTTVDWKASYSNVHRTQWTAWLNEVLKDYDQEESETKAAEGGDADSPPEEFLDPIMMTVMKDPVILPDSKITVDRSTIERHLLTSATDPFNRSELTTEMLRPDFILQDRIAKWIDEQQAS